MAMNPGEVRDEDPEWDEAPFAEKYIAGVRLGQGAFGCVRKCLERATGRSYAVKMCSRISMIEFSTIKEVACGLLLDSSHVVRLICCTVNQNAVFLTHELADCDLKYRVANTGAMSDADLFRAGRQMMTGLMHCHSHGVMHRDVKPGNVLLWGDGQTLQVKLGDFGLAIMAGDITTPKWHGVAGTHGFKAPEILEEKPYNTAVDVWSCGATLLFAASAGQIIAGLIEPPYWTMWMTQTEGDGKEEPAVATWIREMLSKDPSDRPRTVAN